MQNNLPDKMNNTEQKILVELIECYGNDVLKVAYLHMKTKDAAEDVFQETFIKISKHLGKFNKIKDIKSWIITVTINTCRDFIRNPWYSRTVLTDDLNMLENEDECIKQYNSNLIKTTRNDIIWEALQSLPENHKNVLILYCIEDYSTKEIAQILDISDCAVRTRISRARADFKKKYERILKKNERLSK